LLKDGQQAFLLFLAKVAGFQVFGSLQAMFWAVDHSAAILCQTDY